MEELLCISAGCNAVVDACMHELCRQPGKRHGQDDVMNVLYVARERT